MRNDASGQKTARKRIVYGCLGSNSAGLHCFGISFKTVELFREGGSLYGHMGTQVQQPLGFFARLGLAFKVLGDTALAAQVSRLLTEPAVDKPVAPKVLPPEKAHASGLFVLSVLQQDGRLVDFLQQDVAAFSDEDVGAAARVVHGGCRKALQRLVTVQPTMPEGEGATVNVPAGFDSNRIRLTGNVTGQPPYRGTLKHHGWVATDLKFPTLGDSMDYRVIAPAEVEL